LAEKKDNTHISHRQFIEEEKKVEEEGDGM